MANGSAFGVKDWYELQRKVCLLHKTVPLHMNRRVDFFDRLTNSILFDDWLKILSPDIPKNKAGTDPHTRMETSKELNVCLVV
jgi:hypothetical protein